jgi:hyperosmotically inducible periplasmic protein
MKMKWIVAAGAVLGLAVVAAGPGVGQEPKDRPPAREGAGEKAGEKIDRVVEDIKEGVRDITSSVRQRFAEAKASVDRMGVEGRVYGRLHWDKALNDARVEVEVREGGMAVLSGTVHDAAARVKAVSLTNDTVGVSRVVDQLSIAPATVEDAAKKAP